MKKLLIAFFAFIIAFSLGGCNQFRNPNSNYCILSSDGSYYSCSDSTISYFDTPIYLTLYYTPNDDYNVKEIFTYFEDTLAYYHKYFDKYNEYEGVNNLYTINHTDGPVTVDDVLFDAIQYALDHEDVIESGDTPLFNIALDPVLEIWHNARESNECDYTIETGVAYCPVPNQAIENGTFHTNPNDIILNAEDNTVDFAEENMGIDLGGVAKGYVTKIIADHLDELNLTYILNAGNSNVICGGVNPGRESGKYNIALTTPNTEPQPPSYFMTIAIPEGLGVVTSGINQQFFIGLDDDVIYHHIIDPITYYPGGYVKSVTLIYPDSAMADLLSTAVFLLPLDDAKDFVNSTDGLESVWYLYDDTYTYSNGFEQYILQND